MHPTAVMLTLKLQFHVLGCVPLCFCYGQGLVPLTSVKKVDCTRKAYKPYVHMAPNWRMTARVFVIIDGSHETPPIAVWIVHSCFADHEVAGTLYYK